MIITASIPVSASIIVNTVSGYSPIIANFWDSFNSIGVSILITIVFLIMTIFILGWKLLFVKDEEKMWGRWGKKSMILSIVIAIIILLNFIKFYFDFPEFFQFL